MTTRCLVRCLSSSTRQFFASAITRASPASLRPLVSATSVFYFRCLSPALSLRGFATRQSSSSLNDPNPNWSNRPPKETILLDGCDFEHWLVVMEKPENDPTRDEIIDSYIKTLAMVVGSEEEARMKIYSVSTRHYFAFGALVSEELSYKLKELPKVRWVLPDSYLDVRNKDYGGEPFINGEAVPYDPKYHEEWVRNNARANERNRRNDRPRNFDRSRNFDRRRDMQMNSQSTGSNMGGGPPGNMGAPPNMAVPASGMPNMGPVQPNFQQPPNNVGGQPNTGAMMRPSNFEARPNYHGNTPPSNTMGGGQINYGGPPPSNMGGQNYGGSPPPNSNMGGQSYGGNRPPNNNMGGQAAYGGAPYQSSQGPVPNNVYPGNYPSNNTRGLPNASNFQFGNAANSGGTPYQSSPGPNPNNLPPNAGSGSGPTPNSYPPNTGFGPGHSEKSFHPNPGYDSRQNNYAPNLHQNAYKPNISDENPPQNQNLPGRDAPTNY